MKFVSLNKTDISLAFFMLVFFSLILFTSRNVFFWDTIQLASKHAHWFYENQFAHLLLPNDADSGHIPIFGAYLATLWLIFGKSLIVSHWAMLPFVLGLVWQVYRLLQTTVNKQTIFAAMLLLLADPTLLAQTTLVSPDILLLFFFLCSVNAILRHQNWLLLFAVLGLSSISLRGAMVAVAVFLFDMILLKKKDIAFIYLLKKSLYYIPAIVFPLSYLLFHYASKGWIGYHAQSPWADSFSVVNMSGIVRNSAILIWRIIDFGRVFLWLAMAVVVFVLIRKRKLTETIIQRPELQSISILLILLILVLSPSMIVYKGLLGHRYLLPVFIVFALLLVIAFDTIITKQKLKNGLLIALSAALFSGNAWIYPDTISKGWDSTLAHLPYYKLRTNMMTYISAMQIDFQSIGSDFPLTAQLKYTELCDCQTSFVYKNLSQNRYVLQSNICNGFTDSELNELKTEWTLVKEFKNKGVYFRLYKRPSH